MQDEGGSSAGGVGDFPSKSKGMLPHRTSVTTLTDKVVTLKLLQCAFQPMLMDPIVLAPKLRRAGQSGQHCGTKMVKPLSMMLSTIWMPSVAQLLHF